MNTNTCGVLLARFGTLNISSLDPISTRRSSLDGRPSSWVVSWVALPTTIAYNSNLLPTLESPRSHITITYNSRSHLRRVYCLYYGPHTIQGLFYNHPCIIYE